ncbi:MAG: CCA tRNA nucleotidyltransferase [Candidatus Thermoplasmatota archaeon]|nr:CCA tRNA nucleotidyltransferase [Candidatus Thermoplasmatota archaeon]
MGDVGPVDQLDGPLRHLLDGLAPTVSSSIKKLDDGGYKVWIVGGAVRDALKGLVPHDIDIATDASPEEVIALIPQAIPTGIQFGTVTVPSKEGDGQIEITTLRADGEYIDGRHPESVTFGTSIEEDLERRDFTVNSMAIDPINHLLIDPHSGRFDLENGILRAVGDPSKRFKEDGLRVLRAYRFMAHPSGPYLPDESLENILHDGEVTSFLARVSKERVLMEMEKLLTFPSVEDVLIRMERDGILSFVFGSEWTAVSPEGLDDCFDDEVDPWALRIARFALLLRRTDQASRSYLLDSLRMSGQNRSAVLAVCLRLGQLPDPMNHGQLRRYRLALGKHLGAQLSADRCLDPSLANAVHNSLIVLPSLKAGANPLVNGLMIMERLSIEEGPELGRVKSQLYRIQIESDLTDAESVWEAAGDLNGSDKMWP